MAAVGLTKSEEQVFASRNGNYTAMTLDDWLFVACVEYGDAFVLMKFGERQWIRVRDMEVEPPRVEVGLLDGSTRWLDPRELSDRTDLLVCGTPDEAIDLTYGAFN